MMKKRLLVTVIVLLATSAITVTALMWAPWDIRDAFGRSFEQNASQEGEVVAFVNDDPIYSSELEQRIRFAEAATIFTLRSYAEGWNAASDEGAFAQISAPDPEEILDTVIQERILNQEAEKLGIEVSEDEIRKMVYEQRSLAQGDTLGMAEEDLALYRQRYEELRKYELLQMEVLGMTEDEMYEQIYIPNSVLAEKRTLLIERLSAEGGSDGVDAYLDEMVRRASVKRTGATPALSEGYAQTLEAEKADALSRWASREDTGRTPPGSTPAPGTPAIPSPTTYNPQSTGIVSEYPGDYITPLPAGYDALGNIED